jgi:O-succinylbenzoic acid--CoA ligase
VQLEKVEVELARVLVELQLDCRSFVTALPDARLGSRLVAVLEGKPLDAETEARLAKELAHFLSKYERPKNYYYARHFAATPTGKVDKQATLQQIDRKEIDS